VMEGIDDNWLGRKLKKLFYMEGYSLPELSSGDLIRLDTNENWNIPADYVKGLIGKALTSYDPRSYPHGCSAKLADALADLYSIPSKCFIPTNGSDQAIGLICETFLESSDSAYIVSPTFSLYRIRSMARNARVLDVNMNQDFSLPVDELVSFTRKCGGVIFICSPNNPTGNLFRERDVLDLLDKTSALVVVDEAYAEFARANLLRYVPEYENLVVLRTFSKAYGLAGFRLGYVTSNINLTSEIRKVQYPYPVNGLGVEVALLLLKEIEKTRVWIEKVRIERSWLIEQLAGLKGVRVLNSEANFLLASLPRESNLVVRRLVEKGIKIKQVGDVLGLRHCVRITVGNHEMNEMLMKYIREVLVE
jgi:histidinol-phosphate aminotransferase